MKLIRLDERTIRVVSKDKTYYVIKPGQKDYWICDCMRMQTTGFNKDITCKHVKAVEKTKKWN